MVETKKKTATRKVSTTPKKTTTPKKPEKEWHFRFSDDTKLVLKTVLLNTIDMIDRDWFYDNHDIGILASHLIDLVGGDDGGSDDIGVEEAICGKYIDRDICALLQRNDLDIPWRELLASHLWDEAYLEKQ